MIAWMLSWISLIYMKSPMTRKEREYFFRFVLKLSELLILDDELAIHRPDTLIRSRTGY